MCYTRQLPTIILLIGLFFFSITVNAQVIPVEEAYITLNEKKVLGYQMTLSKSQVQIKDGIVRHFSLYSFLPSTDKDIVKLEQVKYPPITTAGPISLYYVLENIDKQLTRMTVVGFDQNQQIIDPQNFPNLSLRLLLDLGKLVRRIAGKPLNFDPIFQQTRDASSQDVLPTSTGFSDFSDNRGEEMPGSVIAGDESSTIQVLRDSIQMLMRELAEARAQRVVDNSRSDSYVREVTELKSRLDSVEKSPITVARSESTVMQWAEARLSALVNEMRASREENQTLVTRLSRSDSLIAAFQAQLRNQGTSVGNQAASSAQACIPQLEQENRRLSVELSASREAQQAAERALSEANNRRLENDNSSSLELAGVQAKMEKMQAEIRNSQTENQNLQQQLEDLKERKASLENKLLANQQVRVDAEKKYEQLIREIATIKAAPRKSVPVDAELTNLRSELKISREEINKLQVSLNTALARDDSLMGLMETRTRELSQQLESSEMARVTMEKELLKLNQALTQKSDTPIASESDNEANQVQMARYEEEIAQLNEKLANAEKAVTANKEARKTVESQLKTLKSQTASAQSGDQQIAILQQENQDLKAQLAARKQEATNLSDQFANAQQEKRTLEGKLQKENDRLNQDIAAVKREKQAAESRVKQLSQQLEEATNETQASLPGLQQKNKELSMQLNASQTELSMTGEELGQLKTAYAKLSGEMDAALAKMDQSEESLREELSETRRKLAKTEAENQALTTEKTAISNRLQETLNMAEQKKNSLNLEITKSAESTRRLRGENDRLSIEVKQLARDNQKKAALFVNAAERADSLEVVVRMIERKNNLLKATQDSLITDIALLNPDSEAAQARRLVYKQQLENLYQAQDELAVKQYEISSREKRIDQRERYLSEFEANKDEKILFSRISDLEKQVQTLDKERFQPIGRNSSNSGSMIIQPANIDRNRRKVPGFMITSSESKTYLKEQILLWFRLKGIISSQSNALRFEQVNLAEISDQMLNIEFSLAVMDGGRSVVYATFELAIGSYINGSSGNLPGKNAEAVLREMFE